MATSAGDWVGVPASSTSEFQSPQAAHLPDQRVAAAPQDWQIKALDCFAMLIGVLSASAQPPI
jgi:hypothetical protein